jgi:hypothetical protein
MKDIMKDGYPVGINVSTKSNKQKIYIEDLIGECCEKIEVESLQVYGDVDVVYIKESMYVQLIDNVMKSVGQPIPKASMNSRQSMMYSDKIKRVRLARIIDNIFKVLRRCSVMGLKDSDTHTYYYRGYKEKIQWNIYI